MVTELTIIEGGAGLSPGASLLLHRDPSQSKPRTKKRKPGPLLATVLAVDQGGAVTSVAVDDLQGTVGLDVEDVLMDDVHVSAAGLVRDELHSGCD